MKSLRLSFVLLLIFSVVTISATAERNDVSLTLEKESKKIEISENLKEIFFKKTDSALQVVGFGKVKKTDGIEVQTGAVNNSEASLLNIPFDNQDFVLETSGSGSTVRVGTLEELVGLK